MVEKCGNLNKGKDTKSDNTLGFSCHGIFHAYVSVCVVMGIRSNYPWCSVGYISPFTIKHEELSASVNRDFNQEFSWLCGIPLDGWTLMDLLCLTCQALGWLFFIVYLTKCSQHLCRGWLCQGRHSWLCRVCPEHLQGALFT